MAYLSRIRLNPQRAGARRLLTNPQSIHAAVLAGIVTQPVSERVLWRLDAGQPLRPEILVVTRSRPSWEHLTEQAGWPGTDDPDDPQAVVCPYEPLLKRVEAGQRFAFRLTANTVESTKVPDRLTERQAEAVQSAGRGARSRHVAHRTAAHQIGWLLKRLDRLGFEIPSGHATESMGEPVPDLRIVGRDRLQFSKRGTKGRVTIQTATFDGRLEVVDPDRLRSALLDGVGRAKAYGCGLLTLANDRGGQ